MRIGINLYLLESQSGGVGNYVMTLLREWPRHFPEHPLVLFTFAHNESLLRLLPETSRRHEIRLQHQGQVRNHLDRMDLYFCPFGSLYPRPLPIATAVLIVDIQEVFFPDFFSARDRRARSYHYTWSMRMADRVLTISDFSRRTFIELAGLPESKVTRVYLCADDLPETARRPPLPPGWSPRFLYYPANSWPHKNHARLFQALRMLRDQGPSIPCVLTGAQIRDTNSLTRQIQELGLDDLVCHLGQVSRAEVAWLYRNARWLIQPSLFEGFGIPLVEAMLCGLPIVCSRTTSLPEVGGRAAVYFDPEDAGHMAEIIGRAWEDDVLHHQLLREGKKRAADFSPHRLVREHLALFEQAVAAYAPARHVVRKWIEKPLSQAWRLKCWTAPATRRKALALLHERTERSSP